LLKACSLCLLFIIVPLIANAQGPLHSEEDAKRYFTSNNSLDPIEGVYFCTEVRRGGINSTTQSRIVISKDKTNPGFFYAQIIDEEKGLLLQNHFGFYIKKIDTNLYAIMKKYTYSERDVFFVFKDNEFEIKDEYHPTTIAPMYLVAKYIKMSSK